MGTCRGAACGMTMDESAAAANILHEGTDSPIVLAPKQLRKDARIEGHAHGRCLRRIRFAGIDERATIES